jgi:hypothetical protein
MVKISIFLQIIFYAGTAFGQCQPPGQGFLEEKLKETFHVGQGEEELREWVGHRKNSVLREEVKSLDRRSKFSDRLEREDLLVQSKDKFDMMILNTERSSDMKDFPAEGAKSKMMSSKGAMDIEMSNLSKDGLDVFAPEILAKLSPKVKVKYFYPYDKFEYVLTYDNKELPMGKALGKIQQEMEKACEVRMIDNREYREWYEKGRSGGGASGASAKQ